MNSFRLVYLDYGDEDVLKGGKIQEIREIHSTTSQPTTSQTTTHSQPTSPPPFTTHSHSTSPPPLTAITPPHTPPHTPPPTSDKSILPQSILQSLLSTHPDLPSPLIFQISSKKSSTFIGVKEFTADPDTILLPKYIANKLSIRSNDEVSLKLVDSIPKGESITLRPLADYSSLIANWKFFLESKLNNSYTTLTKDEVFIIANDLFDSELPESDSNPSCFKLLVSETTPATTICVVDTDIILDIEPINDSNAQKQLDSLNSKPFEDLNLNDSRLVNISSGQKLVYRLSLDRTNSQGKFLKFNIDFQDLSNEQDLDVLVAFDEFVNIDNFIWSSFSTFYWPIEYPNDDSSHVYIRPWLWKSAVFNFSVSLVDNIEETTTTPPPNTSLCKNCGTFVPQQSFVLHQVFCLKNNVKCSLCGSNFAKTIPESHWHCPHDNVFGDDIISQMKHNKIFHDSYSCKCGSSFPNLMLLASHKARDCEFKLHECRFCHLILPQGKSTAQDKFLNLTNHESSCGSKTTECFKCKKILKLKDLSTHMKMHDLDRLNSSRPVKCANINCISTGSNKINEFALCDFCYGPLYSTVLDPDHSKLMNRIERKYVIQLTRGCGNSWCKNPECKSSGLSSLTNFKDVLQHIKQDLLTRVPLVNLVDFAYFFCVNESIMKKKLLVDYLAETKEGNEYDYQWICEGVMRGGANNEPDLIVWLHGNAIRRSEIE